MDLHKPFTVEEVLKRPLFQNARVAAGKRGITRPVRWVHVLEVPNPSAFVNGHELILTTGVGLGASEDSILRFVQQLVEKQVSGLCIELVQRFTEVPPRILQYADEHDFPILVFEREVRFIDIMQDLQSHIINRHHQQLLALEALSKRFLQLTLQPGGTAQILKLLYRETGCPVRLRDEWGRDIIYPEKTIPSTFKHQETLCQPIFAMDMHVGDLCMAHGGRDSEYMRLILDRAATAIAQELLRQLSIEERRMRGMQKWIEKWLKQGRSELPENVTSIISKEGSLSLAAMGITARQPESHDFDTEQEETIMLKVTHLIQHTFKTHGLQVWMAPHEGQWALVLVDQRSSSPTPMLQRVKKAFSDLFKQLTDNPAFQRYGCAVGISQTFRCLNQAPRYWKQASLALKVSAVSNAQRRDKNIADIPSLTLYDDLHAWQLFLQVDTEVLSAYIQNQIGPLLEYDRKNGTDLVRTLETFFETGQSKQQTAKVLYIHRQTLYYRLEQISTLLGDNWIAPERRRALDIALTAHRFLSAMEGLNSLPVHPAEKTTREL